MKRLYVAAMVAACAFSAISAAQANVITPSFMGAPAGWSTDRYQPDQFVDMGSFQGRNNVLYIQSGNDEMLANRPPAYQFSFYNTQGMSHPVAGGVGDTLAASLWIPQSWSSSANGLNQDDMWGVMKDGLGNITGYPIIGFTNVSGSGHFQIWDDVVGQWDALTTSVLYDSWNDLSITMTAGGYDYSANEGPPVFLAGDPATTAFSDVIFQTHNLDTPQIVANNSDPDAHWSNTPTKVPEPFTASVFAAGLAGAASLRRRKKKLA